MEQLHQQMSCKQICWLWLANVALVTFLWRAMGCHASDTRTPEQKAAAEAARQEMVEQHNNLRDELKHPRVQASFQAGYQFGAQHKSSGLSKLNERELDAYAMAACRKLDVPATLQGHAVRKFKTGYGWGWFNGK